MESNNRNKNLENEVKVFLVIIKKDIKIESLKESQYSMKKRSVIVM